MNVKVTFSYCKYPPAYLSEERLLAILQLKEIRDDASDQLRLIEDGIKTL
jgi:hypothetical protein